MPTYEFKCEAGCGVFERDFRMADMPQTTPCDCGAEAQKILSLFGSISTSDDPSFGSSRGEKRNREMAGFDDTKHGWEERPQHSKSDWEYA